MALQRILLAVTGLSPQIVTETLYALCVTQNPAWVPDEIHLITSGEGFERARLSLLDPEHGRFLAFCRDYPIAKDIRFSVEHIHRIKDADAFPLNDIRTPEDNALAADAIHQLVKTLTARPDTELHVSIAGGRKTMGFYLGYCLSLTARPQDKLSHVLVSEPFESLPEFYFPPAQPRLLHTRDGRPIHTADAKIMLAEIPFVRLRSLLPTHALNAALRFSEAVAATQAHLDSPRLEILATQRLLICGNQRLTLPPQLFAWYAWMARRCQQGLAPIRYTDADGDEFLAIYGEVLGSDYADYEQMKDTLHKDGFSKEFFEQKCAKTNRLLKEHLGPAASPYLISPHGKRPMTRHGLKLSREHIEFRMQKA